MCPDLQLCIMIRWNFLSFILFTLIVFGGMESDKIYKNLANGHGKMLFKFIKAKGLFLFMDMFSDNETGTDRPS